MFLRRLVLLAVLIVTALGLAAPARAAEPGKVVLVGIAGLRWSDVNRTDTPTLYDLAGRAAIGQLSVRTVNEVTCPDDAWLTLSAGQRATTGCGADSTQRDQTYRARPGLLGDSLRAAKTCATAVGPGAELALSGAPAKAAACPLTVVDLGALPSGQDRRSAVRAADQRLADTIEPGATILVTGLSDEPTAKTTRLRLGLATGPGFEPGWLGSSSTRQDGIVQLTDLTPTLTGLLGIPRDQAFAGSPWRTTGDRPADLDHAIARLNGFDTAERVVRQQSTRLFAGLAAIQLLGYGIALLTRRRRPAMLAALVAGTVPAATFLAGFVPWSVAGHPSAVLWTSLLGFVALLALATDAMSRTPTVPSWIAPTVLAGATTVALAADVMAGSRHQTGNLMTPGDLPVVGGRFFGFGNVAFAIFVTSALLLAGGVAAQLQRAGRKGWPAVLAIGAVAVFIDGWPGWGADFGGILAAVPAVIVLAAGVAGVRLTAKRVLLTALATVAAVTGLAVADWLRPPESRSHLGGFVQQVIDGDALPVIVRKAEMSLGTVVYGGPLAWLAILVLGLATFAVLRPPNLLRSAYGDWPALRPTLHALLVLGLVGFAVNDSGLVVPAVVFATALPLTVLAMAGRSSPRPRSEPGG